MKALDFATELEKANIFESEDTKYCLEQFIRLVFNHKKHIKEASHREDSTSFLMTDLSVIVIKADRCEVYAPDDALRFLPGFFKPQIRLVK